MRFQCTISLTTMKQKQKQIYFETAAHQKISNAQTYAIYLRNKKNYVNTKRFTQIFFKKRVPFWIMVMEELKP